MILKKILIPIFCLSGWLYADRIGIPFVSVRTSYLPRSISMATRMIMAGGCMKNAFLGTAMSGRMRWWWQALYSAGKKPKFRDFVYRGVGADRGGADRMKGRNANVAKGMAKRQKGGEHRREDSETGGARHVSFFLIIIFNPIHCMVQRFALNPTSEIL